MNQLTTIEATEAVPVEQEILPATKAPTGGTIMADVEKVVAMADLIVIDSQETYDLAAGELLEIKKKQKALTDQRFAITRPLEAAKKNVIALFKPAEDKLGVAESTLKHAMLVYDNAQEAKAREAQRVAEAAAAAERKRLQDISDEAAAEAAAAAESGDTEAAEAAAAQAETMAMEIEMVTAAAPPPSAFVPKATGVTKTTRWSAEVTDKIAYIRHVLDHEPELIDTITIDMKPLNQMAVALKDKFSKPGVKAVSTTGISAGRG